VLPICVVDQDFVSADDFGDDRNMTGRHVSGALEDNDRAECRPVPAGVSPLGFVPPPAGRTIQSDASFGADEKCAVGGGRRPAFYATKEKGTPNEA
jgi:hypothetical protein